MISVFWLYCFCLSLFFCHFWNTSVWMVRRLIFRVFQNQLLHPICFTLLFPSHRNVTQIDQIISQEFSSTWDLSFGSFVFPFNRKWQWKKEKDKFCLERKRLEGLANVSGNGIINIKPLCKPSCLTTIIPEDYLHLDEDDHSINMTMLMMMLIVSTN